MYQRQKALSRAAASAVAGLAALVAGSQFAHAQLRIVQYNTGELKTGQTDVFQAIGLEQVNGIAKPFDIMVTEEIGSSTTGEADAALNAICTALNGIYGAGTYLAAPYTGLGYSGGGASSSGGGGFPGVIYRPSTVTPVGLNIFGTVSSSANTQSDLRYQMRPVGYDSNADFYLYASHFKATDGTTEAGRRKAEVLSILADSNGLGNVHAIYAGDYNFYRSTESGYQTFTGVISDAQATDPLTTANWEGSTAAQKIKHTQSPVATGDPNYPYYGGQVGGGMDDRFDFQLSTAEVQDGLGFSLISGSYRAFGNNGSHSYAGSINFGNGWTNPGIVTPQAVLDALARASDHIPVVADYMIPAKMTVTVTPTVPSKIIKNTPLSVNANVSNTAPVSFTNGADGLSYAGTVSGSASGAFNGTDAPMGGSNNHTVTLSTATTGTFSGGISVTTSSQGAAGNNFSYSSGNYVVLDHSNASFDSVSDTDARTINFGYVPQGFASRSTNFAIRALNVTPGLTARLDVDSVNNAGDTASLSTNVTPPITNIVAGTSAVRTATLTTATAGTLSATHTFGVSDEDAATGATAGTSLVLTTTARVISSATFPVSDFIQLNTGETYNTGPFAIQGGVTLSKTGPGTLNIDAAQSNGSNSTLDVTAGIVTVGTDAGSAGNAPLALSAGSTTTINLNAAQHLRSLTVSGGQVNASANVITDAFSHTSGKLDLKGNKLIVHNGDTATIAAKVATGLNGGAWNGSGIITSETDAASPTLRTTLGVASASNVLGIGTSVTGTWAGETVAGADTLVKYTWNGDANFSGFVDADDYFQLDSHYGDSGVGFFDGDFNYSGTVDGDDYVLIDIGYSGQDSTISGAPFGGIAAVPEPACAVFFALPLLALSRRRRR